MTFFPFVKYWTLHQPSVPEMSVQNVHRVMACCCICRSCTAVCTAAHKILRQVESSAWTLIKPKLIPNTSVINVVSCFLHLLECFFFLKTWNQFTHIPRVAEAPYHWEHSGRIMRKVFQKPQPSHHRHTGTKWWIINLLTNSNTDRFQLAVPPEPSYKLQHQDSTHLSPYSTFY